MIKMTRIKLKLTESKISTIIIILNLWSLWGKKSFSDKILKIYIDLPPPGIIGFLDLDRLRCTHRPGIKGKNFGYHLSPTP